MDSLNINSVLKQLSEIARRRDVMKKKNRLDQKFVEKKFEEKVTLNKDVLSVEKKEEEILFEGKENTDFPDSENKENKKKDSEKNTPSRIKENFKANFLDLRE